MPTWAEEMNAFKSTPIVLLEIDFPSGTKYYSFTSVRFPTRYYEGKILGMSPLRRVMQQFLGLVEISSMDVSLADVDASIIDLTESDVIKGVNARIKVGTQALDLADFETVFDGLIDDYSAANFATRIIIKDRLWTIPPKPDTGYVNTTDFPNALPAHVGKPLPVCYGTHSETELTDVNDYKNRGAWPTLFIDVQTANRYFLIARHAVKTINEVYAFVESKGSQLLTLTTDYVPFKAGTVNGETMAYISLTSTGWTKLTDTNGRLGVITVNVEGKETIGDGTGTLITDPIYVLTDFLEDYLGDPPVDAASFATAQDTSDARNYVALGGYTEEKSSDMVLRDIANSFNMRLFQNKNGEVSVNIFQPISPVATGLELREQWEILKGAFSVEYQSDVAGAEDTQVINSIDYRYKQHWAKGHSRGTGSNSNTTSITTYGRKPIAIDMPWAADITTANDVAQRIISLYKNPVARVRTTTPLLGMNIELGNPVVVTHEFGPGGGYASRAFEVIEHSWNPSQNIVEMSAKDVGALVGQAFFLDDEDLRIVASGQAEVTNSSGNITIDDVTTSVSVGDIIRLKTTLNDANRSCHKITGIVDIDTVTVANTTWVTESGLEFDIIPSWLTKTGTQEFGGHVCDISDGEFSNGDEGLVL